MRLVLVAGNLGQRLTLRFRAGWSDRLRRNRMKGGASIHDTIWANSGHFFQNKCKNILHQSKIVPGEKLAGKVSVSGKRS